MRFTTNTRIVMKIKIITDQIFQNELKNQFSVPTESPILQITNAISKLKPKSTRRPKTANKIITKIDNPNTGINAARSGSIFNERILKFIKV